MYRQLNEMRCEGHLCNVCHGGIKGIAYRTHCYHLFCPACAQDNFHRQNACPICGAQLSIENVTETTIGTKCDKIVDQMFQFALGGSDIEESMKLTVAMLQGIEEVSLFVHTQLREQRHAIDRTHREREEHCRAKEEHLVVSLSLPTHAIYNTTIR